MLKDSVVSLSIVPTGEVDIKYALELGMSIMLDKPIIALIAPGAVIPMKLQLVADHIIEVDLTDEASRNRLSLTLAKIISDIAAQERSEQVMQRECPKGQDGETCHYVPRRSGERTEAGPVMVLTCVRCKEPMPE